ncbi:Pre-mRNA cleavage complex II protein Clp1-domain-containing protein [Scleroderma yunnanense]
MLSAVAARKAARPSAEASGESFKPPSPSSPSLTPSREWSPSRPNDSEKPQQLKVAISNFTPVIGHNTLPLTDHDLCSLGFQGESAVLLTINAGESLALVGVYLIVVLRGGVSLCGVTLRPSSTRHRVFAPRSSPIPVISWTPPEDDSKATQIPLPSNIHTNPDAAIVLIQRENTGVQGLGRVCRVFEHVFKPPRDATTGDIGVPEVHLMSYSTKDMLPFILPPSWGVALAQVDPSPNSDTGFGSVPLCIVKGPKKSGKSTFSRALVNRLLNRYRRVAFLECDIGQSEFTPVGMVGLNIVENYIFGPPFTHPTLPYRAHFVGSTTPRTSPSYYLSAVQSLLETYRLEVHIPAVTTTLASDDRIEDTIPLVVNTMGWTKGLGLDINTRIEELLEPSHIFEIEGSEERGWATPFPTQHDAFSPFGITKDVVHLKLEAIPSEATNMHAYTAADHRNLNILSYFHAVFPFLPTDQSFASLSFLTSPPVPLGQITAERWDVTLPLCARYPYEVACDKAFDGMYLVGAGYEDVVPSELIHVLNGAVVGLVTCDSETNQTGADTALLPAVRELPYIPGQAPPRPSSSNCFGLALIRGVSPSPSSSLYLHVLTPLPPAILAHTRVLIKGDLELPIWGMLDFREGEEGGVAGIEKGQVPYLQWGKGEGVGSERRRVRRNLMRRAQM